MSFVGTEQDDWGGVDELEFPCVVRECDYSFVFVQVNFDGSTERLRIAISFYPVTSPPYTPLSLPLVSS